MGKKQWKEEWQREQERKKERRKGVVPGAVIIVLCVCIFLVLYLVSRPSTVRGVMDNGSLTVPAGKIGSDVAYIQYGGTQDIMAWRDSSGEIRTSFSTCEDCYASGAHYTYEGDLLVCSYCGNTYSLLNLGEEDWGGCQPVAIPVSYRADTDTELVVPAPVLEYAERMFLSWRGGDYTVTMADYEG